MNKTIQTKRNKPAGSNYRVLYAKTGRKRRLHAATATVDPNMDIESDVPRIGIGRALLVILVLHVLAIGAIYIHSTFFGNDSDRTANQGQKPPTGKSAAVAAATTEVAEQMPNRTRETPPAVAPANPVVAPAPQPAPSISDPESERYIVVTGDSYPRIAQVRNVDEHALRALNSNRPLRAGVVLDLPAQLSSRPVDPRPARALAIVEQDQIQAAPPAPRTTQRRVEERSDSYDVSNAPKAIVVKPNRPAPAAAGVKDSGTRYTIKPGDTLWSLSRRHKVSRDALLKLNGIEDPNKLYAGRTIKIPAN